MVSTLCKLMIVLMIIVAVFIYVIALSWLTLKVEKWVHNE